MRDQRDQFLPGSNERNVECMFSADGFRCSMSRNYSKATHWTVALHQFIMHCPEVIYSKNVCLCSLKWNLTYITCDIVPSGSLHIQFTQHWLWNIGYASEKTLSNTFKYLKNMLYNWGTYKRGCGVTSIPFIHSILYLPAFPYFTTALHKLRSEDILLWFWCVRVFFHFFVFVIERNFMMLDIKLTLKNIVWYNGWTSSTKKIS